MRVNKRVPWVSGPTRDVRRVSGRTGTAWWLAVTVVGLVVVPRAVPAEGRTAEIFVRVLVADAIDDANVCGLDMTVLDAETRLPLVSQPERCVKVWPGKKGVRYGTGAAEVSRLAVETPAIFVTLNGREYRAPLEFRMHDGLLMAISHIGLEQYLPGIVAAEMPSYWPMEALKAQAVAARTYAWNRIADSEQKPYDLTADVRDQVYPGSDGDSIPAAQAVKATRGIVLVHDGKVADVRYHATCGGATEVATNVWPSARDPLPGVRCPYCADSPFAKWRLTVPGDRMARLLAPAGFTGDRVTAVSVDRRSPSGRALTVTVEGGAEPLVLDGNTFRRRIGYSVLRSTRFVVREQNGAFEFEGEGFGHGVGMCQWGARNMALSGKSAEEILRFYYPGTERRRLVAAPGGNG